MQSIPRPVCLFASGLVAAAFLGLTACGGSSHSTTASSSTISPRQTEYPPRVTAPANAKRGGTLTVIANADVDYIDPGAAYYQPTYMIDLAADSPLVGWPPNDTAAPVPLLASGEPEISDGGKTITLHIKTNIRYSPPTGGGTGWNKPVVSQDVKYAIERGLIPGVPNGYVSLYFADLNGLAAAEAAVKKDPTRAPNISGITTPNASTIVFNLSRASSTGAIDALSLPLSSPVPEGYAAKYDSRKPSSTYGEHQIDVGPYYISSYQPGKQITLLRNPNWTPGEDFRPAYLNKIVVQEGFSDTTSAVTKILTGQSMVNFDIEATGEGLKLAATQYPHQLTLTPAGGTRYVALNTAKPPFNNLNTRKAVIAATDREALLATRGGALSGKPATHFIPPGVPGFQQAGGIAGPTGAAYDFIQHPTGDMVLAESYMKKAGYPSGKCSDTQGPGHCTITMVGTASPPDSNTAQEVRADLQTLGFDVHLRSFGQDTMFTKFCLVVSRAPNVCPNVGWLKDFNDGQAMIDVPFNGATIAGSPTNNANYPQLNDPAINNDLDAARLITDPTARAAAYGKIDDLIVDQAPAIPWDWNYEANVASANVLPVINESVALTDLSFTSMK
jgi:peptide/nickel transport system substrate-binding protein